MDADNRRMLIERYRAGYAAVAEAVRGLSDAELDKHPDAGWSTRQIVHHLADAEMIGALRLRQLLAEDHPTIASYDEPEYARRLHYDRPIASSLESLRAVHEDTAEILDRLSDAEWAREGLHSESGHYTPETWLVVYAAHAHDHAAQIRAARGPQQDQRIRS